MRYQLALGIHERIEEVLRLIKTGEYSTPALAAALRVSIPTISRIVAALREKGHDIRAQRTTTGWCYVLIQVKELTPSQDEAHSQVGRTANRYAH
jgi:biotin operon repressor